jgi:hypothetical protein
VPTWQAYATFAIARHAAVDLMQVLGARHEGGVDRLSAHDLEGLDATWSWPDFGWTDHPKRIRG